MTITDIAMVILVAYLGLLAATRLPRLWRGEITDELERSLKGAVSTNPSTVRAIVRTIPVAFLGIGAMASAYAIFRLTGSSPDQRNLALPEAVASLLVALFLFSLVADVTIILFNRPTFLVPHGMRDDRGLMRGRRRTGPK